MEFDDETKQNLLFLSEQYLWDAKSKFLAEYVRTSENAPEFEDLDKNGVMVYAHRALLMYILEWVTDTLGYDKADDLTAHINNMTYYYAEGEDA